MFDEKAPKFTFIDLFAGVGGFHHALAALGGECVLAVELDPESRKVYAASFDDMEPDRIEADIRSLTRVAPHPDADELAPEAIRDRVPEHKVLCAGFPCQPFSKSGFQRGVRDRTRGTLFFDVMSIILACEPEYVILENVRNLAGPRHEDTWQTIVDSLREAGYLVSDEPAIFSPHHLAPMELTPDERDDDSRPRLGGAPQVRDRVFILARRARAGDANRDVRPLAVRQPIPGWDPDGWDIREYLDRDVQLEEYGLRPVEQGWMDAWQAFVQGIREDALPGFPIWVDAFTESPIIPVGTPAWKADFLRKNSAFYVRNKAFIDAWLDQSWGPEQERVADFPPSRRKFEWQARRAQWSRDRRDLEELVAHLRPSGIRVKAATYLPALVAITQTSILGPKVTGSGWRRLTPREAARLQGLPYKGFKKAEVPDKTIYKQLGNAVNVGVVHHLAKALFADGDAPWMSDPVVDLRSECALAG